LTLILTFDTPRSIVITHGLNGAPYRTFCDERTGFFWPPELGNILPKARVMVFGYVADISAGSSNTLGVYQHAEGLLLHLKNNRIGPQVGHSSVAQDRATQANHGGASLPPSQQEKRPLVLLGHSLGGVVIKQVGKASLITTNH